MTESTRDELEAQLAEMQRQMAALQAQLDTQGSGDRGVSIGGNATHSPILTGSHNAVFGSVETVRIASAVFQAAPAPGQVAPKELLFTYLNQLLRDLGTLDLAGVDRTLVSEREGAELEVAAVYTALDTLHTQIEGRQSGVKKERLEAEGERDHARQSALAFVNGADRAVLLGDPGSGKSTFVNFLALCMAGELLQIEGINLARLGEEWTVGVQLPVHVVLRDFAAQLSHDEMAAPHELLWRFITKRLYGSQGQFVPYLEQHLVEEGGLLILDGLDEVAEAERRRALVKEAVVGMARRFPKVRIVLTSRTYAYQHQQWRLPHFAEAVLAPFDSEQIARFVDGWYAHLAQVRPALSATDAQGRAALLKNAIERNNHLRELAPRPLLLTLMASLHAWRGGSLPEDREQLYQESVELLLDIWEQPKVVRDAAGRPLNQTEGLAAWINAPRLRMQEALEEVAYTVHGEQKEATGTADINEAMLVAMLLRATNDRDLRPARVLEYIRDRAGLLSHRAEGVYSFPHRTFQEYLAARYLTRVRFPNLLVQLVQQDAERWREVLLLAGAKVARGTPYSGWSLVNKLCPVECVADQASQGAWQTALLAGRLLLETGIHRGLDPAVDADDAATLTRVRSWLAALVAGGHLPPADRALAGVALGRLGDPRPGVGVKDGAPDIEWCEIAPGPFVMGSDKKVDGDAHGDELPQFTCTLIEAPYCISRYPITVAQYGAFVAAGGYNEERYWTEGGWRWRQEENIAGPDRYGGDYETPNHPQVGVSWYEAMAYCAWLSEVSGQEVRLPTEAEWERAARHTDGRIFAWGNEFEPTWCNMSETGIGVTSAVGIFPGGNAKCGAADMTGNVLEWCSTKWLGDYADYENRVDDTSEGDERRVLRGGAFLDTRVDLRCAYRDYLDPRNRFNRVGWRVVSPGLCGAGR
ncbi:MAG: SUMF1/EgtB/PvdO family nonheme iron enzyme [Caldilineaceae bacterium]|nr:SUMF1/EgtB/PvdO family nonheme iron enzyme [Caldilineaceae bacterium]